MNSKLDVLQYLAMEGIAETEDLRQIASNPADVQEILEDLEADGYVVNDGFWYLSDEGEEELAAVCRSRFSEEELEEIRHLFDPFEELDSRMKELASKWQTSEYSTAEAVERLIDVHSELVALFDQLPQETREIYDRHLTDLTEAVEKVRGGQEEYLTGTDIDSYHTVWFRLHDDLLRTLGEERES